MDSILTRRAGESKRAFAARRTRLAAAQSGADAEDGRRGAALSEQLYNIVLQPRNELAEQTITEQFYGDVKAVKGDSTVDQFGNPFVSPLKFFFRYGDVVTRTPGAFETDRPAQRLAEPQFLHEDSGGGTDRDPSAVGHLAYVYFEPVDWDASKPLATLFLFHGVPVNKSEWYNVARKLGRFMRVVCIDLLGMGESSKPLAFHDAELKPGQSDWFWTFATHAKIFRRMLLALRDGDRFSVSDRFGRRFEHTIKPHPQWFVDGKVFLGANDWGAGLVDTYVDLYHADTLLHGIVSASAITLNFYWVPEIGSFTALANAPYGTREERKAFAAGPATAFSGTFMRQIIQMYRDAPAVHMQATYQWLVQTFYDTGAYDNPASTPATTIVRAHNVRVLAEQAAHLLGKGQLLPFDSRRNPNGLRIDRWNLPVLKLHGKRDDMMGEASVNLWCELARVVRARAGRERFVVTPVWIENGEHFAVSDNPARVAEAMLNWCKNTVAAGDALRAFASPFLGFDTIAQRNEAGKLAALRAAARQ